MDIAKYTGIYATSGAVKEAVVEGSLHKPYIAIVRDGNYIDWNTQDSQAPEPVYSAMPLTIRILSDRPDQYFVWGKTGWGVTAKAIRAKYNDDEPEELSGDRAMGYEVHAGDIIQFWGDNAAYGGTAGCHLLSGNCRFEIYGNLASLLSSTGFTEVDSIPNAYALARLFQGQTGLTAVSDLSIGNNILGGQLGSNFIYRLFHGCSNLNYIKIMLDGNIDSTYSNQITKGVSATGTFVKPSGATWATGVNGVPDGWTVEDADI